MSPASRAGDIAVMSSETVGDGSRSANRAGPAAL